MLASAPRRILASSVLVVAAAVAACGGPGGSPPSTGSPSPDDQIETVELVVGLGYIPSVQFAPFYLAQQNGYYEEVGLDVEFQNRIDPDLITLVGQGSIDVGLADGTSIIPAVSQGIPVRYLATIYGRFPSIVFAKASSGIATPADLEGRRLGMPGRYGSSWIMLQAMLASADLTVDDLEIVEYPDFGQGVAVAQGAVDAATGFANNEPVQLELTGEAASILRVDEIVALQGPGLIAGERIIEEQPDVVQAFVTATLQAMEEIAAEPELGLDAAIAVVPELASDRETQMAILEATIDTWRGPVQEQHGLGAIDRDGWLQSIDLMTELGLVPNPVTVDDVLRDDLLPAGD